VAVKIMNEENIAVRHEADIIRARATARSMALGIGFDETRAAEVETAVSELATNLVKHRTVQAEIVLRTVENGEVSCIEVTARDKGPGIKDMERAMRGGESTAGSLGIGLSGVKRLMDDFSIESSVDRGTTIVARKCLRREILKGMDFSVFSKPRQDEDVSGDAYFIKRFSSSVIFSIVDALGHGKEANKTALNVLEILEANYREPLHRIIELTHKNLISSRGAAMALCKIDFKAKRLEHVSIGNVETRVYGTAEPVRPICYNGTLGMAMENYRVIDYPYVEGSTIVMFSDGISGRFDLDPSMLRKTPQEISYYIFDVYKRNIDDATVLVGK